MPGGAGSDIKLGFYVGIGVVLALTLWGLGARVLGGALRHG